MDVQKNRGRETKKDERPGQHLLRDLRVPTRGEEAAERATETERVKEREGGVGVGEEDKKRKTDRKRKTERESEGEVRVWPTWTSRWHSELQ